MSTTKGFPSQKKPTGNLSPYDQDATDTRAEFVTAQLTSSNKVLQDGAINGVYRLHPVAKTLEAGSAYPKREMKLTAHGAAKGDVLRFEPGSSNPGFEANIQAIPDADTIILAAVLEFDSVVGDEVFLMRYVTARYSDDGSINVTTTTQPIRTAGVKSYNADASHDGNITTAAPVIMFASLVNNLVAIEIDNTTGQSLYLLIGGTEELVIPAKGLSRQSININASSELSVQAIYADATFGEVNFNLFR